MGVTFNRMLTDEESLVAGSYTLRTESGRASLRCPICGNIAPLPSHCRVEPDGRVVPAIKCLMVCAFFDFVTLESHWLGEEEL